MPTVPCGAAIKIIKIHRNFVKEKDFAISSASFNSRLKNGCARLMRSYLFLQEAERADPVVRELVPEEHVREEHVEHHIEQVEALGGQDAHGPVDVGAPGLNQVRGKLFLFRFALLIVDNPLVQAGKD